MAMLAEPRRRQRIGPNPRGQLFTDDSENVGRSMLRNMGWKDGDGLGVTHQGISEPIKPKIQQDSRGLGFDIKSNPWVTHNDKFSELLANLNAEHVNNDSSEPETKNKVTETSVAGNELEKKSKSSRARIHYHKSIKNKDLSKISNKDWSCIFGKSVDLDENNEKARSRSTTFELYNNNEELESETEKYVNAGSMTDYFKTKMKEKLAKQSEKTMTINPDADDHIDSTLEQPEKKKKKKHKNPDADTIQEDSNLEQPLKKKKKKHENPDADSIQEDSNLEQPLKKQKKHENPDSDSIQEDSNLEQPMKTKKKKRRNLDENATQDDPSVESNSTVSVKIEVDLDEKVNTSNTIELDSNNAKLESKSEKFINAGSMTDYFAAKMKEKLAKQSAKTLNINLDTDHINPNIPQPEKKKKKKHENSDSDLIQEDPNLEQPLKKKKKKRKNLDEDVIQDDPSVESNSTVSVKIEVDLDEKANPSNTNELNSDNAKLEPETGKFVNAGCMTDYFETKMKEKLAKQSALSINLDTDHMDSNLEQPEKKKKKKHKNPDADSIQEDSNLKQPLKKKKKKRRNLEEDVIQDPVESKSAESAEGESNENEETQCANNFSPAPKLRYAWDETTVKSVAKKYVGANIIDIPGYPIRPHVNEC